MVRKNVLIGASAKMAGGGMYTVPILTVWRPTETSSAIISVERPAKLITTRSATVKRLCLTWTVMPPPREVRASLTA